MPDLTVTDQTALKTLIAHQRLDIGSCICGWGVDTGHLGQSHALHVWRECRCTRSGATSPATDPSTAKGSCSAGWKVATGFQPMRGGQPTRVRSGRTTDLSRDQPTTLGA